MANLFNTVQFKRPKRNFFDLSHDVKMSLNMGELVPVCAIECVPGDKFTIGTESLIRFSPLVAPVMHRFDVYTHYFFVPNRIIWQNWEKFITNTKDKVTNEVPAFPHFAWNSVNATAYGQPGSLADYLGIPNVENVTFPSGSALAPEISALPFAAYQRIWHEYYRDQNLQDVDPIDLQDGENDPGQGLTDLRRRAWKHDYFTAALPFAQKGDSVDLPLGQFNDVTVELDPDASPSYPQTSWKSIIGTNMANSNVATDASGNTIAGGSSDEYAYDPQGTLVAKTSEMEMQATTINDLRRAFRLQEWLERNARSGTRYIENILSHFGVKSSDKRLNRPEYITGAKSPITVSEVLQTSETAEATPQGNMAGHGVGVMSGKYGNYYCEEHGYIIGIMSILPVAAYQQGIPRHFLKQDFLDFYWPTFAHLGEQEIKNMELFVTDNKEANDGTFGYIPRYAEYKYTPSRVAGEFTTSLNYWHAGRIFEEAPALNEVFIQCDPTTRIFAVEDANFHKVYAHVYNKIKASRPMPKFGQPTI